MECITYLFLIISENFMGENSKQFLYLLNNNIRFSTQYLRDLLFYFINKNSLKNVYIFISINRLLVLTIRFNT